MDREGKPDDIVIPLDKGQDIPKLPPHKSPFDKVAPVLFWGGMMALPAMGLAASYFMYKTAQYELMTALVNNTPKDI